MTNPQYPGPQGDPRIARQVEQQAGITPPGPGGGSLFTERVLVVNQKTKLIELTNEYAVFDQHGNQLGSVVQTGQGVLRKLVRLLSDLDQYLTHHLEVRDRGGRPVLRLTRPGKIFRSRVVVRYPDGRPAGEISQKNMIGKINFALTGPDGRTVGEIRAENWRAWNFAILDGGGVEVARVTKTWEGLARTMFTTADKYVVQIHRPLVDPMLTLVVAAALTIDTALKQDERG